MRDDSRAFFELLEADLRALSAEARKTDSLATQITGWLQHTDFPQIKEGAERAVLVLRTIVQEGGGVAAVRNSKVRLWRSTTHQGGGVPAQTCASVRPHAGLQTHLLQRRQTRPSYIPSL